MADENSPNKNHVEAVERKITFTDNDKAESSKDEETLDRIARQVSEQADEEALMRIAHQELERKKSESSPDHSPARIRQASSPVTNSRNKSKSHRYADTDGDSLNPSRASKEPSRGLNDFATMTKKRSGMQARESYEAMRDTILSQKSLDRKPSGSMNRNSMKATNEYAGYAEPSRVSQMIQSRIHSRHSMESRSGFSSDEETKDDLTVRSLPASKAPIFKNGVDEVLFKTMKKIRPKSAKTRSSTATSRSSTSQGKLSNQNDIHQGSVCSKMSMKSGLTTKSMSSEHYLSMANRIDRLSATVDSSKHKGSKLSKKYASYDEQKNCTFRPKIQRRAQDGRRSNNSDSEEEAKAKSSASFIDRQTADEKKRRAAVENRRGKQAYDAILDKKFCPRCGGKRSYDEYKDKKKRCSNCNVEYTSKVVWTASTGRRFFKRDEEFVEMKEKHTQELKQKVMDDMRTYESHAYDEETGKLVKARQDQFRNDVKWDEETREEFYARLEAANERKAERFAKIKEELSFPFAPTISSKKTHNEDDEDEDEGGEGSKKNVARQFLERMERDLEKHRRSHPPASKVKKANEGRFAF